jgi:hypothetical protein
MVESARFGVYVGKPGPFKINLTESSLGVSGSGDVDRAFDDEVHVVKTKIKPTVFLQLVQTIVNLISHLVLDVGF